VEIAEVKSNTKAVNDRREGKDNVMMERLIQLPVVTGNMDEGIRRTTRMIQIKVWMMLLIQMISESIWPDPANKTAPTKNSKII
jgi:hypothetical protein